MHAYLYPEENHIKIVDNNSKYGTYLVDENGRETKVAEPLDVYKDQKILFGKLENIWIISKVDFNTTTSTISESVKKKLQRNLDFVGGSLLQQWTDECTHVTMPTVSVTLKVLQALVSLCPIVSPDYWNVLIESVQKNEPLPDSEKYIPEIIEKNLNKEVNLYKKNPLRSKLFVGKKIIFLLHKDLINYQNIIMSAGGTCDSAQKSKITTSTFYKKNVIVIRPSNNLPPNDSQCSQGIEKVEKLLKAKHLRCIPEIELGLAILHCSLEKYCNPESCFEIFFKPIKYSENKILARNTASYTNTLTEEDTMIIPDSELDEVALNSYKRKNSSDLGNVSKKASFDASDEIQIEPNSVDYELPEINIPESPEPENEIENDVAPKTTTIVVGGFINTSQIVHEDFSDLPLPELTSQEAMPPPRSSINNRKTSKRLARTFEADDEDLFNFEDSEPIKRQRVEEPVAKDLFAFDNSSSSKSQPKQPKTSKPASRPVAKNSVEMPIISIRYPVQDSTAWMSTTMIDQLKIDEIKIKDEDGDIKPDLSLSNPFKVKVMNISFRRLDVSVVSNESSINSGKKNFKGFVKKLNYKPQTQIVTTEPFCV